MNTFLEYKKSITVGDSAKTKVDALQTIALKGSRVLSMFKLTPLVGKYTNIPIITEPKVDATTYTVGGLRVVKKLEHTSATLVDETTEDANPNMEVALDNVLTSQVRMKLEKKLADGLVSGTVTPGPSAPSFSTAMLLLKKFPESVHSIEGQFFAAMSYSTWYTVLESMTEIQHELVKQGVISIFPVIGMPDDKMAVAHTHGVAFGVSILGVEKERVAGSQMTYLITQLATGYGQNDNYVKFVTLS